MRDYRIYLRDIPDAAKKVESFVGEMDFEAFQQDDKTSGAVIRKLETIGKVTQRISQEVRDRHPYIPWRDMAGMRTS